MGDCSAIVAPLRVKVATEEWEFREIHRLNHATFADEIPQHEQQPSGLLVDTFHDENTYLVALRGDHVVGMLAVRGNRPFSLERKLPDLDSHLPTGYCFCEVRLLAIAKSRRSGRVLQRLLASLWRYSLKEGFDAAVISGTPGQLKMYRRLGFVPFGSLVGSPGAQFQPMYVTRQRAQRLATLSRDASRRLTTRRVNLLPGPVDIRPTVRRALRGRPQSHRCDSFTADLSSAQQQLCQLTGAAHAVILVGSGTLANDAIAAQLSLIAGRGLILTNGEFGERLIDHASRWGLDCDVMGWPWGTPLDLQAVGRRLSSGRAPGWLWFVHLETSTGVLNDLHALTAMCSRTGVRLCVDAISSTGTVPVGLRGTWFGSAVSGKGLGACPGLSIVFHSHPIEAAARVPRYLDLALYARSDAVPFTHSSNLVRALKAAIEEVNWERRHAAVARRSAWLRAHLRQRGFDIISAEADAAPGVVTIALPSAIDSLRLDKELSNDGYLLAATSEYLRRRNWIQISLMSQPTGRQLRGVVDALCRLCALQLVTGAGLHTPVAGGAVFSSAVIRRS